MSIDVSKVTVNNVSAQFEYKNVMEKPSDVSQELRSLRNYNLHYKAASEVSDDGELVVSIPNTVNIEPISKGNEKKFM